MKITVEVVFPNARHRWCIWHIMKKIPEKLQGYSQYKEMKRGMKTVVYESTSVDDFLSSWANLINMFNLSTNDWLSTLFEERHRWVPCYLKSFFWAGMSTTQRSESMNAFFDGYINSSTSLQQFVQQYENALQHKAELECEADFASLNTIIPCTSLSGIERQFQSEYTHAKLNEVQGEFRGKMNCAVTNAYIEGDACRFTVVEESFQNGKPEHRNVVVLFDREQLHVCCTCLLFEFRGILCRHCLVVLAQEKVTKVPKKYVLERWSKNLRRKHTYIRSSFGTKDKDPQVKRYDGLCKKFYDIAEHASGEINTIEILHKELDKFVLEYGQRRHDQDRTKHNICGGPEQPTPNTPTTTININGDIRSPILVKRKGRPRSTRQKSRCEKASRRKNTCTRRQLPSQPITGIEEGSYVGGVQANLPDQTEGNMNTFNGMTNAIAGVVMKDPQNFLHTRKCFI
ncbi:protein FAR1-RELATED SEQUENCE 6-like [Phaseolus vulgaris]|uniref:protein FAR1-RELATED SEQUENCE 6-like n=1 Tax=Phaseolus vulgaris TaxID=3885 RepID=UPI0035C9B7F5